MGLCEIYNVFGCSHMPLEPKPCAELICKQHHVHEQEISSFPTETLQAPTPLKGLKIEYCPALEALYVNNFVNLD